MHEKEQSDLASSDRYIPFSRGINAQHRRVSVLQQAFFDWSQAVKLPKIMEQTLKHVSGTPVNNHPGDRAPIAQRSLLSDTMHCCELRTDTAITTCHRKNGDIRESSTKLQIRGTFRLTPVNASRNEDGFQAIQRLF